MSFLRFDPTVFVVENDYEILACSKENGIFSVKVGEEIFYPANSGVLSSEKTFAKIRIPQKILNEEKAYTLCFRKSVNRKAYFSVLGDEEEETYSFNPLLKEDDIHIYAIADVHYKFALAEETATYFGDNLDILFVNGDIGEVETMENYYEVAEFTGALTKGGIPALFSRGNHDTRGHMAEFFTEFFPSVNGKTYYSFSVGPLSGVVLDCGEDKTDNHAEYGGTEENIGTNIFHIYREEELSFLKSLPALKGKYNFAMTHVCPVQTCQNPGCMFDIERELYAKWNREIERIGVSFMVCGHIHRAYVLLPEDPASLLPHSYPVIVGPKVTGSDIVGCAMTLKDGKIRLNYTDRNHNVTESYTLL